MQNKVLKTLHILQQLFVEDVPEKVFFQKALSEILSVTGSEYGFIGKVLQDENTQAPYLQTIAITDISWSQATKKLFEDSRQAGMKFTNLDTLFGAVIRTGIPVISNDPAKDTRSAGLPDGHPVLDCFLGIPLYTPAKLVGLVGIANRPQGYDKDLVTLIEPVAASIAQIIQAYDDDLALRSAYQESLEKQQRLEAILNTANDAIITFDENGIIDTFNKAATRIFGYSSQQIVGKNVDVLVDDATAHEYESYIKNYVITGKGRIDGPRQALGREIVGKHRDGHQLPLGLSISHTILGSQHIFTGIVRDLSIFKKQEEQSRKTLEMVAAGLGHVGTDGKLRWFNKMFADLLDYTEKELYAIDWQDVVQPEEAAHFENQIKKLSNRRCSHLTFETKFVRKDKLVIDVSLSISLAVDDADNILYFVPVIFDITADKNTRRQIEQKLAEFAKRDHTLLQAIPDVFFMLSPSGLIIDSQNTEVMDIPRARLLQKGGTNIAVLFPIEYQNKIDELLQESVANPGMLYLLNFEIEKEEIEHFEARFIATGPNEAFLFVRNITDVKRMSEQKYRSLFNNSLDAVLLFSRDKKIVDANAQASEEYGYSNRELRKLSLYDLYPKNTHSLLDEKWELLISGQGVNMETKCNRPDEIEVVLDISYNAVNIGGEDLILSMGRNVTEKNQAALELERSRLQVLQMQKVDAVGRLAGGIAHDFNNALTVIQWNLHLARNHLDKDSPILAELADIQNATEHAASLTKQLLAFSRKQLIEPKNILLQDTVRNLESMIRPLIAENIRLEFETDNVESFVHIDPSQIEQVILNLVVNARDAMPQGGTISIQTHTRTNKQFKNREEYTIPEGKFVHLTVRDTGIGMDETTLNKVFEPFFTTKPTGSGVGLGLSTVYGIIKQANGFVEVESSVGNGATFSVLLPVASNADVTTVESVALTPTAIPELLGDITILVVEDEAALRKVIVKSLEGHGYNVLAAANAEEALELAESFERDELHMLLSDIVMPGMNGAELAEKILELQPNVKTLFTTGYTEDQKIIQELEQGTSMVLHKPFTPDQLLKRINSILNPEQ